ncbi:hypothetical protein, partial [Mycobacterium sp.]
MATKTTLASQATGLVLLATVVLPACTPRPEGPAPAAERFFAALSTG